MTFSAHTHTYVLIGFHICRHVPFEGDMGAHEYFYPLQQIYIYIYVNVCLCVPLSVTRRE